MKQGLWILGAAAIAISAPATAQVATGDFRGTIEPAPGTTLRLVLHLFEAQEGGGLVGTMDSIDQGAKGLGLGAIRAEGQTLTYSAPGVAGGYEGRWDPAKGAWVGTWTQSGSSFPLTWTPVKATARPPLTAVKDWALPSPASRIEPLVAANPNLAIAAATVSEGRIESAVRGGAKQPANESTRFEIGSVTKLFTDLLLADMVSRGEVRLDDPVSRYLPAGTLGDHGNRPITLRDLATHYSGLPRLPANLAPTDKVDPYAGYEEAQAFTYLKGWTPDRRPGAMFEYSNFGVGLLGQLLARRAGKPYDVLLRERVLTPLGMRDTDFSDRGLATPHDDEGTAVKPWHLGVLAPAGGLRSTIGDMVRFASALIDPPAGLRKAVALMHSEPLRPAGDFSKIGLGLLSVPTTQGAILNHDGGTGGMRSSLYVDRERRRAVVVLANAASGPNPRDIGIEMIAGVKPPQKAQPKP